MAEEKILTRHPAGKRGVNIDRVKYDLVKRGINEVLKESKSMKPMQMLNAVAEHLKGQMEGSIQWYAETVKLDMEAHGELIHDRKKGLLNLN